ncbi:hypothetical protein ACWJKU_13065 [Methylocaldum sp. MU1018]
MNPQFFRARKSLIFAILTTVGALSALGSRAHADAWVAFDDKPGTANLSTDSQNPSILNQVTVVCPEAGFLLATTTATAFLRNLVGTKSTGFVVFSISRQMKRDETYDTVVVQNLGPNTYANIPASVQRIEACTAGESITYYHTAHGFAGEGNQTATEGNARLVVQFFNGRI